MSNRSRLLDTLIGRSPDTLSFTERSALAGQWVALAAYQPANLALRRIAAIGATPQQCREVLLAQGQDPAQYQYILMHGA